MSGGPAAEALRRSVAERVAGTPYQMVETPDGFDLRIELADARWYGLLGKAGRKRVVQHRVTLDEPRMKYVVLDDLYDVRWDAVADVQGGRVPRLVASGERRRTTGRVMFEYSFEKTIGVDAETKKPDVVVDYVFDASQGQRMIREPAKALGWSERWNTPAKVGVFFAVLAGVGLPVVVGLAIWGSVTGNIG
ncbi:hypothetical protein [Cellulomonas sp. NPDC058312]|jgi:hypothetical protein|uniref:hypothetical protein n=1 Tax=Cellulomonas sp. NPDC058312 TaxID=3346441 RepID=UPI0036EF7C7A